MTPRSASRPRIGLFITDLTRPWTVPQWLGVVDGARRRNADLICFPGQPLLSHYANEAQSNVLYDLANSERLDGIVLWTAGFNSFVSPEEVEVFAARYRPKPMVSVEQPIAGVPNILMDEFRAIHDMIAHLIEVHGYRRIAFIKFIGAGHRGAKERYRAYTETLAEYGIAFDPSLVSPPYYFEPRESIPSLSDWLLNISSGEKTAIVGYSDHAALGALNAVQSLGIRIPEDIALTGFDDIEESRSVSSPLTTVRPAFYEMGVKAVDVLLDVIEGKKPADTIQLPVQLVIRHSCGCQDSSVTRAAHGLDETDGNSPAPSLLSQKRGILSAMAQTVEGSSPPIGNAWDERLWDGFLGELRGATEGSFLRELEETLGKVLTADADILKWQDAISTMRRLSIPHLEAGKSGKAEDLWHQARVMIGALAQRQQAARGQKMSKYFDVIREIQAALISTFDIQALMTVLAESLPKLGIAGCYLSMYENPQHYHYPQPVPESSRLILAFEAGKRLELEPEGRLFTSRRLLPDGIWPNGRPFSFVAEPIYFQSNQLGFILFEVGPRDGIAYETLHDLISSALEGALLMKKEQKRSDQLLSAAVVSHATSSILEPEELLRQVVSLISDRFGLASVGLFLVDDATQRLVLKAGVGYAGHENTVRVGEPNVESNSLIEICVANARALIGLGSVSHPASLLSQDRSEMALPFISRARAIGALSVRCARGSSFSDDEVKVLQTMADQIANAIENARLFEAQKAAEQDLEEERTLLRVLIDQIPDYIYIKDKESRFLLSNRAHTAINGARSSEDLLGKTDFDFFERPLAEKYFANDRRIVETGESLLNREECSVNKDGRTTWVLTSKVPFRDSRGDIIGIVGVSRNITDQKRVEETLRLQSARLQTALDVASTVTALLDVGSILRCVADLIREKFGYYCVNVFLIEEDEAWATLRAISCAAPLKQSIGVVRLEVGDHSMIGFSMAHREPRIAQDIATDPLYLPVSVLPDTRSEAVLPMLIGNTTIGALDVQSDRTEAFPPDAVNVLATMAYQIAVAVQNTRLHTEEKQRSRELREAYKALRENQERSLIAEKMASLGRLTAGIAHEMNTPIASLRASLMEIGRLTDEYQSSIGDAEVTAEDHREIADEMKASIRLANTAAERAASFVRGIKTQTRNIGQIEKQRFDAVPIIEESLLLLSHASRKANCALNFEHPIDPVEIVGSPGGLAQVVTNLVTNAIDASDEEGEITLSIGPRANGVELRVTDKGMGIPPENLSKIFDPLFTTKPIGQGTGLGLTIVHDIVVGEFGGTIDIASAPSQGTSVTLFFPKPTP